MKKSVIILIVVVILILLSLILGYSLLRDSIKMTGKVVSDAQDKLVILSSQETIKNIPQSPLPFPLYPDVPFSVLSGGVNGNWYLSCAYTFMCPIPISKNILTDSNAINLSKCLFSLGADEYTDEANNNLCYYTQNSQQKLICNNLNLENKYYYKRNYQGSSSIEYIWPTDGGVQKVIAINHGENKNEVINSTFCLQNTVNPSVLCRNCYSGTMNGVYDDCWEAYSGFVTLSYAEAKAENAWGSFGFIEQGPIVWPSNGYSRPSGTNEARGVVHPTSIAKEGYLYVFYLDESKGSYSEGRGYGIKVARAQIQSNGLPGTFKTYFNGAFTDNALPSDFNKDSPNFNSQGGRSSPILAEPGWVQTSDEGSYYFSNSIGFAVTKIKNSDYYLGIEHSSGWFNNQAGLSIVMWLSKDLVNWGSPIVVPNTFRSWDLGSSNFFAYVKAFNKELTSNAEVNISDFYLMGVCNSGTSVASICYLPVKLGLENILAQTPTCTSFTYSSWTTCNASALQSKTITSQAPSGCTGGTPDNLIQQCSPPCTPTNWQSSDSACLASNTLTRSWTRLGDCNQTIATSINKPNSETISCIYVPNIVICTDFNYSEWSECFANGIQNRSLLSSTPANCQAGNSILTQTCNYTAIIINPPSIIDQSDNNRQDNTNSENNDDNQDNVNTNNNGNQQITPPDNSNTDEPVNLGEDKKEPSAIKMFFVKLICKLSNLFDGSKYATCVENYS